MYDNNWKSNRVIYKPGKEFFPTDSELNDIDEKLRLDNFIPSEKIGLQENDFIELEIEESTEDYNLSEKRTENEIENFDKNIKPWLEDGYECSPEGKFAATDIFCSNESVNVDQFYYQKYYRKNIEIDNFLPSENLEPRPIVQTYKFSHHSDQVFYRSDIVFEEAGARGAVVIGKNFWGKPIYRQVFKAEISALRDEISLIFLPVFTTFGPFNKASRIYAHGGYLHTSNNQEIAPLNKKHSIVELGRCGNFYFRSVSQSNRSQAPAYIWIDFTM